MCYFFVCYNKNECWTRRYDNENCGAIDASIVTTHMMLQAWELGVGSTWVMHFNPFKMREAFEIPENVEPVALLYKDEVRVVGSALGLPDEMVYRQPFPGPGLAIRILGVITREKADLLRRADAIFREELERRLRDRGDTDEEQIRIRLNRANWEMDQSSWYDYVVVNDQVETCAEEILNIIANAK